MKLQTKVCGRMYQVNCRLHDVVLVYQSQEPCDLRLIRSAVQAVPGRPPAVLSVQEVEY